MISLGKSLGRLGLGLGCLGLGHLGLGCLGLDHLGLGLGCLGATLHIPPLGSVHILMVGKTGIMICNKSRSKLLCFYREL